MILSRPCSLYALANSQEYHQSASTWWLAMMMAGRDGSAGPSPEITSSVRGISHDDASNHMLCSQSPALVQGRYLMSNSRWRAEQDPVRRILTDR